MSTTERSPRLSDEGVRDMLKLMKAADSIELKLTIPEKDHRSTATALAMDPLDAQIRQLFFFDTPDLTLNKAGVVARVRRVQGKRADSVVKLRPVEPSDLPGSVRRSPSFGVEVDAMPGGYVCSGSFKGVTDNDLAKDVVTGQRNLRKLFTKEQRKFFKAHAPDGITLDDLSVLGPIFALKLKWVPEGRDRPYVAELWMYPDGSQILELSTKCAPSEAFDVAIDSRTFLVEHGVDVTGEQQTKTKKALEFFAKQLKRGSSKTRH